MLSDVCHFVLIMYNIILSIYAWRTRNHNLNLILSTWNPPTYFSSWHQYLTSQTASVWPSYQPSWQPWILNDHQPFLCFLSFKKMCNNCKYLDWSCKCFYGLCVTECTNNMQERWVGRRKETAGLPNLTVAPLFLHICKNRAHFLNQLIPSSRGFTFEEI